MRNLKFILAITAICLYFSTGTIFGQQPEAKTVELTAPQSLGEYEGRYTFNPVRMDNFVADLTADGSATLKMKLSHRQERTFKFERGNVFADTEYPNIKIVFVRDKDQKITGLELQNFRIMYYFDEQGNAFSQLRAGDYSVNAKKIELPPPSTVGSAEFNIKGFPNARVVALAGSFNGWNQSKNLCFYETDAWVCRLDLAPGRYTYKFVVDGAWMIDPANKQTEDDEHGNRNSVKTVEAVK